jgi:nitrilase
MIEPVEIPSLRVNARWTRGQGAIDQSGCSVDVPGPATEALGEAARQANAHVVIGVVERDGGTLYCSVLFFAPDGKLMGKHRKLMPTAAERLVWGFGDGSTMPVLETSIGR